ncbi:22kda glycoprotein [Fusarium mundagurra]|uniref:22kda glycoprotein n=1 Tax=Fusarium mundagurra TaxID=1567541 RepID=A0A8H5YHU0_9HYPO|nr:22kda glycoprotein [Fusarium mundagurra]
MKFFTTALLSAAAVSAENTAYEVRDFTASCIPHSKFCNYKFRVLQPGTMETWKYAMHCSAHIWSDDYLLPNVKNAQCGDGSERTFSVKRSKNGLSLYVSESVTTISYLIGKHFIPNKQLWQSKTPKAEIQVYKGPKDFNLDYVHSME